MPKKSLIAWYIAFLFLPILVVNLMINGEQQFVFLAQSFLEGSLAFTTIPYRIEDLSLFNGQYFWPEGPFPAIVLLPFVLFFKTDFLQGFIQFPLNVLNFYLVYKICNKLNLKPNKSLLLAVFYIFGSVYTSVAIIPWSWFFAQVITTTLLLSAIYIFLEKGSKSTLAVSLLIASALLTRLNLITTSIFFLYLLYKKKNFLKNFFVFTIPILIAVTILGIYNYQRFGSVFESGYRHAIIPEAVSEIRSQGILSVQHVPRNLYYMLIGLPKFGTDFPYIRYDPWGMSFFIFSPILFLLIKTSLKEKLAKISLVTTIITIVPLTIFYSSGYIQVGYRYALDFLPFLLLMLIPTVKKTKFGTLVITVALGIIITWFFIVQRISGF